MVLIDINISSVSLLCFFCFFVFEKNPIIFSQPPKKCRFFENRQFFTYFALAIFASSKHILKTLLIESIGPQLSKKSKILEIGFVFLKIEHFKVGDFFQNARKNDHFIRQWSKNSKSLKEWQFSLAFWKIFFSPT